MKHYVWAKEGDTNTRISLEVYTRSWLQYRKPLWIKPTWYKTMYTSPMNPASLNRVRRGKGDRDIELKGTSPTLCM
jgi:hypothetical protein